MLPHHQGVMQEYFHRVVFKDAPHAQLGLTLVGTTIEVFVNMLGPLYQFLVCRYGVRLVLILGTLLLVLGLEMSGFATEVYIKHVLTIVKYSCTTFTDLASCYLSGCFIWHWCQSTLCRKLHA